MISNTVGPFRLRNKLCAMDSMKVKMYGTQIAAVMSMDHLPAYWRSYVTFFGHFNFSVEELHFNSIMLTCFALPRDCVISSREPLLAIDVHRTSRKKNTYAVIFMTRLVFTYKREVWP